VGDMSVVVVAELPLLLVGVEVDDNDEDDEVNAIGNTMLIHLLTVNLSLLVIKKVIVEVVAFGYK
jgi:hypothetical protein